MSRLLILTTSNDISLPLFFLDKPKSLVIDVVLFEEGQNQLLKLQSKIKHYDIVYFRDPYNTSLTLGWEKKIKPLIKQVRNLKLPSIDQIYQVEDFLIEDKWQQYQLFNELMPKTKLLNKNIAFSPSTHFLKKRISSRSKGVLFSTKSIKYSEFDQYIIQEKLDIQEEYRIFALFNKIIQPAAIKSSKTKTTKVKINRDCTQELNPSLFQFVNDVLSKTKLDFVGLDVALTKNGKHQLIEINRSPQFKAFFETTGINLASQLLSHYG